MLSKRIIVLFLILTMLFSQVIPVSANYFKASDITIDTLYENGILVKNINTKYKTVTNLEVVKALYRLELLCDYHIHDNKEIQIKTTEQSLFWMYSCLNLPDDFLTTFKETEACTKETLSVLFYYFAKHLDFHLYNFDKTYLINFSDYLAVPEESKEALSWALQNNIIYESYTMEHGQHMLEADNIKSIIGYSETINAAKLEMYFLNYFLYLEMEKTHGDEIVDFAKQFLGYDYIWGGCTKKGFDCSGFVYYVFENSGYDLGGSRNGAHAYSTRYGTDIMDKCFDINGDIDWEKVPKGAVIGFDWEGDGECDHVGIWTGASLIHARGGPFKQYAYYGYMVCEYFEGEGNGLYTTFDYAFNDYYQNCIVAIRSFEKHRTDK